jgi:hypothetical protein
MARYTTGIKKDENCSSVEDIQGYRVSFIPSDIGKYYSKLDFFSQEYAKNRIYKSYNPKNKVGAKCEMKVSESGTKYLQTVKNGTEEDNLLSLPNIQKS